MTCYCRECEEEVMPTETDGTSFRCPMCGWNDDSREWTPERMQRRIDELRALARGSRR